MAREMDVKEKKKWVGPDAEYIVPLYRLAVSNVPNDQIANWLAINALRYSNQMVKRTLKRANREDLIDYLIKEEDIKLTDTIKSRMTGRVGTVCGIKSDGDTITVKWDSGGRQMLSKESVFKLRSKEVNDTGDITHVNTCKKETYENMQTPKVYVRDEKE
jgi:hypothetical protein